MSLREPRCLVCGAPLSREAPFKKDVRNSEVCSDECYEVYMHNEDEDNQSPDSDTKYSGNPDKNPRKAIDVFHAPML